MLSSWCVGALVRGGVGGSGFTAWVRGSLCGGEDLGLSASSLDGGLGLTPFTYAVVGRVTVEKEGWVNSGEHSLVSAEPRRKNKTGKIREEKNVEVNIDK